MGRSFVQFFFVFLFVGFLSACKSYQQNIMFKVDESNYSKDELDKAVWYTERNYVIQKNDFLRIDVFTNDGERIIDPDFVLDQNLVANQGRLQPDFRYLVREDGMIKLPMVGDVGLEGKTLVEAEAILQEQYSKFYKDPFVNLAYDNKRVVVLGAPGGMVIPLENENMRLVEVLAMAQGVDNEAKADNIRLIRGQEIVLVDFSTFEGYKKYNMIVQPGDIIYIEPIRRPFLESTRDYGPLIALLTSVTSLIVVIISLN